MTDEEKVARIEILVSHIWVVRTFLKHSEEAEEDEELRDVFRGLYDFCLALGGPSKEGDIAGFLKIARKKIKKLRATTDLFIEIQPEISSHTNFQMAAKSLTSAVQEIEEQLA